MGLFEHSDPQKARDLAAASGQDCLEPERLERYVNLVLGRGDKIYNPEDEDDAPTFSPMVADKEAESIIRSALARLRYHLTGSSRVWQPALAYKHLGMHQRTKSRVSSRTAFKYPTMISNRHFHSSRPSSPRTSLQVGTNPL